ncbi:MAG: PAS domain-containing protein [Bacteroidetes bacterium]|nr:PAS domain-containing protein [Bacteroidota bacterium]
MTDQQTIKKLLRENAGLKNKIAKLTKELSKELIDNVEHANLIHYKDKNFHEILDRHNNLLHRHNKMENRYKVMAENVNDMISVLDQDGFYIYANQKSADFYQSSVDAMVGKSFRDIMSREMAEKYEADIVE